MNMKWCNYWWETLFCLPFHIWDCEMPTGSLWDLIQIAGPWLIISESWINYWGLRPMMVGYDVVTQWSPPTWSLGIQSCISWQSDPRDKFFVVDFTQEFSSYRSLPGQKEHLSGSEISAFNYTLHFTPHSLSSSVHGGRHSASKSQSAVLARLRMCRGQPRPGFCCLSISGHWSQNWGTC